LLIHALTVSCLGLKLENGSTNTDRASLLCQTVKNGWNTVQVSINSNLKMKLLGTCYCIFLLVFLGSKGGFWANYKEREVAGEIPGEKWREERENPYPSGVSLSPLLLALEKNFK
jgi:hypothetical protein